MGWGAKRGTRELAQAQVELFLNGCFAARTASSTVSNPLTASVLLAAAMDLTFSSSVDCGAVRRRLEVARRDEALKLGRWSATPGLEGRRMARLAFARRNKNANDILDILSAPAKADAHGTTGTEHQGVTVL